MKFGVTEGEYSILSRVFIEMELNGVDWDFMKTHKAKPIKEVPLLSLKVPGVLSISVVRETSFSKGLESIVQCEK